MKNWKTNPMTTYLILTGLFMMFAVWDNNTQGLPLPVAYLPLFWGFLTICAGLVHIINLLEKK